jgi:hypothetical protein
VPAGETLYTDFSAGLPPGSSGNGELILGSATTPSQGREGTFVAAPAISGASQITGQYFYDVPGHSETFTFTSAVSDVALYVGSLDATNSIELLIAGGPDVTYTGAELATLGIGVTVPGGSGTILASTSNGRLTFIDATNNITGVVLSQGTGISTASFEVAQITTSTSTIPEPSTWVMMSVGFIGLGYAAFRRGVKGRGSVLAI